MARRQSCRNRRLAARQIVAVAAAADIAVDDTVVAGENAVAVAATGWELQSAAAARENMGVSDGTLSSRLLVSKKKKKKKKKKKRQGKRRKGKKRKGKTGKQTATLLVVVPELIEPISESTSRLALPLRLLCFNTATLEKDIERGRRRRRRRRKETTYKVFEPSALLFFALLSQQLLLGQLLLLRRLLLLLLRRRKLLLKLLLLLLRGKLLLRSELLLRGKLAGHHAWLAVRHAGLAVRHCPGLGVHEIGHAGLPIPAALRHATLWCSRRRMGKKKGKEKGKRKQKQMSNEASKEDDDNDDDELSQ